MRGLLHLNGGDVTEGGRCPPVWSFDRKIFFAAPLTVERPSLTLVKRTVFPLPVTGPYRGGSNSVRLHPTRDLKRHL
jgi:hypothetical protein